MLHVTPLVFQMSEFGIRNMDQVAPVSTMYRGMLKVSTCEQAAVKPHCSHLPARACTVFLLMLAKNCTTMPDWMHVQVLIA